MILLRALAACWALAVPARAQLAVSPGDTGALLLPVADNAGGAGNLNGVQVSTSGSPIFIPPTSLGPVAVLQGATNYFLLNYRIPAQAFAGPLSVNLTLSMTTPQPLLTSGAVSSTFTFNVVGGAALGPDVTAPRTALFFDGPQFTDGQGNLYISTGTSVRLQAADPAVAGAVTSGVAQIFFLLDRVFVDTSATPPTPFTAPFTLSEGTHTLSYFSADMAGNLEPVRLAAVRADGTPPVAALSVTGSSRMAGGLLILSTASLVGFVSNDPPLSNAASVPGSGAAGAVRFFVDAPPEQCAGAADSAVAPPGSCADSAFVQPFALSLGTHTLFWLAGDNVGNVGVQTARILVFRTPDIQETRQARLAFQFGSFGTGPGQFQGIFDVAVDHEGNVYASDQLGVRIEKFAPDGTFLLAWGGLGSGPGQFGSVRTPISAVEQAPEGPVGLSVSFDPAMNHLLAADTFNQRVQIFTSAGGFLGQIGPQLGGSNVFLREPAGVACDAQGNVYIADHAADIVYKTDHQGNLLASWQTAALPLHIKTDPAGNVYVSALNSFLTMGDYFQVMKYSSTGALLQTFGAKLHNAPGVALDAFGNVYVMDGVCPGTSCVRVFRPGGESIATFAASGFGLAINQVSGRIYVADTDNNRIDAFDVAVATGDIFPPVTTLVPLGPSVVVPFGGPGSPFTEARVLSPTTPLSFSVVNKAPPGIAPVGVAFTEYSVNGGPFIRYTSPFTATGLGTLQFHSVDLNGNVEPIHAETFITLSGPPASAVFVDGARVTGLTGSTSLADGVVTAAGSLSIGASRDGGVSGGAADMVTALLDGRPVSVSTSDFKFFNINAPGSIEFTLSVDLNVRLSSGPHVLVWAATNFVGNTEAARSLSFNAAPAPAEVTDLAATPTGTGDAALTWTATGDNGLTGQAAAYDLRSSSSPILTSADFAASRPVPGLSAPGPAGSTEAFTAAGLPGNATVYFDLRVLGTNGNASRLSNLASVRTPFIARSTVTVGAGPELAFTSVGTQTTAALVSTTSAPGAVVLGSATAQGLVLIGNIYGLGPEATAFSPAAVLTFRYSTQAVANLGLLETDLAIYRFDPTLGLVKVPGQTLDTMNKLITAPLGSVASIFAVFARLRDGIPPVTALRTSGGARFVDASGNLFLSSAAAFGFDAFDPVVAGTASGVAFTEFRVDAATPIAPFARFTSSFTLAEGAHLLEFRSQDNAGNLEVTRSSQVVVDATPPTITLSFAEPSRTLPGGELLVDASAAHLLVQAVDPPVPAAINATGAGGGTVPGSGVGLVQLTVDGQVQQISVPFTQELALGIHQLAVTAADNVGNAAASSAAVVVGDLLPPTLVSPPEGFITSAPAVAFQWRQPVDKIVSLAAYDLIISTDKGFQIPGLEVLVASEVAVSIQAADPGASLQGLTLQNGRAVLAGTPATTMGVWTTPFIPIPAGAAAVTRFVANQRLGQGSIAYEFSLDGTRFLPVDQLLATPLPGGGAVQFRATLSRTSPTDLSPMLLSVQLVFGASPQPPPFQCLTFFSVFFCRGGAFLTGTVGRTTLFPAFTGALQGLEIVNFLARLVTGRGTLSGTWTSEPVPIPPGAYKLLDFKGDFDVGGGSVALQFTTDGANYQDVAGLAALDLSGLRQLLQFRALLSRPSIAAASPVFRGLSFAFLLPPPTGSSVFVPDEGYHFWKARSMDFLGRTSADSETRSFLVDRTPPVVAIASPTAGQRFVATKDKIRIAFTVKDDFDPAPTFSAVLLEREDRGTPRGNLPSVVAVSTGQALDPLSLDDGIWELAVSAADFAGNSTTTLSGRFEVIHDTEPPRTVLAVGDPRFAVNASSGTISVADCGGAPQPLPRAAPCGASVAGAVLPPSVIASSAAVVFITSHTSLTLSSIDDLITPGDGVGLGVAFQSLSVDGLPRSTFTDPSPSPGQVFSSTFTLASDLDCGGAPQPLPRAAPCGASVADGLHFLAYFAQDIVGNAETVHAGTVAVDDTPPVTSLALLGGRRFPGPDAASFYASSDTRFALPAFDPVVNGVASGLAFTQFQDNGGAPPPAGLPGSSNTIAGAAFQAFVSTFGLAEGAHRLGYQSRDNVANLEVLRSTTPLIDATPPVTTVSIGAPTFTSPDGTIYVSTHTPVTFTAADPPLPRLAGDPGAFPGSGVNHLEVAIDGGPFAAYTAALTFAEGRHAILYRAVDNVGNVEAARTLNLQSDGTPPVSSLVIGAPRFQLPNILLVSSRTPFSIAAVDPVSNNVASGVKDTFFRVSDIAPGTAAFSVFAAPFSMAGADVNKVTEFFSRDNVLNTEVMKSSTVLLDSTPPEISLLSPPACDGGICRVLKGRFPVLGTARDLHLRDYRLEFAAGQNASSGFTLISSASFIAAVLGSSGTALVGISSGTLGVWDARSLAGRQTLRLTATDLVQNVSVLAINVFVGDPGELLTLGNHELFNMPEGVAVGRDGKIYVADRDNDRIAVFSSSGAFLAAFGSPKEEHGEEGRASSAVRLNKPSGVAVDGAGDIFVADTNDDRVLKLSAAGQILLELGRRKPEREEGRLEAGFTGPGGPSAKPDKEVFSGFSKPGRGPGEFNKPSGVAVDPAGGIYVSDTENRRVQVFSSTGAFTLQFPLPPVAREKEEADKGIGDLGKPVGIALDAFNHIYVADPKGHRALEFSATGQLLLAVPIQGLEGRGEVRGRDKDDKKGRGELPPGQPMGIAVTPSGNCLLVSDRKLSRILKFDIQGNRNLNFGARGKLKDEEDKPKVQGIVFNKPFGLALDGSGDLFVADRNNDRVREFGLPAGRQTLVVPPPGPEDERVARDVVDKDEGGTVARKDKAAVEVPTGALAEDLKITVSTAVVVGAADESRKQKALADKSLKPVSAPVEYNPEGTTFSSPVTLTLPYSPELASLQGVSEDDLKVHYWNRDKSRWEDLPSVVDKKSRTVAAKTTHFSLYQVLSGTSSAASAAAAPPAADPSFIFRDLYAFPNPAIRGKSPTIRLQVGVADSVDIHIYDISGKLVHQAGISSPPQPLDDGNGKGAQYTYDFPWDVSGVGSGVYIYSVTAKKAGHADIRRIKKLGIVR